MRCVTGQDKASAAIGCWPKSNCRASSLEERLLYDVPTNRRPLRSAPKRQCACGDAGEIERIILSYLRTTSSLGRDLLKHPCQIWREQGCGVAAVCHPPLLQSIWRPVRNFPGLNEQVISALVVCLSNQLPRQSFVEVISISSRYSFHPSLLRLSFSCGETAVTCVCYSLEDHS